MIRAIAPGGAGDANRPWRAPGSGVDGVAALWLASP
jgi:hypothetical protein